MNQNTQCCEKCKCGFPESDYMCHDESCVCHHSTKAATLCCEKCESAGNLDGINGTPIPHAECKCHQPAKGETPQKEGLKECSKCHETKPEAYFEMSHRRGENWRINVCKACGTTDREAQRRKRGFYQMPSTLARSALREAVRKGTVKKEPCFCGEKIVQGHHHNGYGKNSWLDVQWLCREHHRQAHHGK